MIRSLQIVAALAVAFVLTGQQAIEAAPLPSYNESIAVTSTNATKTLGLKAGVVIVDNQGSNEAYIRWDATAVAAATTNILIPAGRQRRFVFAEGRGPTTVGVISSSGETTTVQLEAYQYDGPRDLSQVGATVDPDTSAVPRAQLVEDALQTYGIPVNRIVSNAGAALTAAETAGTFDITIGTNTILANGEVTDNETEVSVAYTQFVLPPEYVAGGDVTIRLPVALVVTATPTNNGSTIDLEVYEQSDAGAVGADLCATAAQTFAALSTWYNKDFTITPTGLVAGDVLNIKITSSVVDSEAGAGTIVLNLAPPKVLLDIKG